MSIAYFQSPAIGLSSSIVEGGKSLVKRAIIAIEGTHTCNRGKKYEMPPAFIETLANNTNAEIANGRIVSLYREHNKSAESCFGDLVGMVECRPVLESDLPNPAAKGMLGKMAIFANANIKKHLDLVASGAIKALSPGIDMGRKLIFEVSEVPVASMPGVALFRYNSGVNFSFKDVLADRSRVAELRDEAIEGVDVFIESLRILERNEGEMTASINAKQESFGQFVNYLAEVFEIPSESGGIEYSKNPYDQQTIKTGFSYEQENALDENEKEAILDEASEILLDSASVEGDKMTTTDPIDKPRKLSKRSRGGNFSRQLQGVK